MNAPTEDCLSATAVAAQLQRVLGSAAFVNAPILSRFLRYVVERSLARDGCALKEYTLGVEVFGRGCDFDPRIDTIVRTHARRLRARLEDYYRDAGRGDPILIEVPKGHYVPLVRVLVEPGESGATATRSPGMPSIRTERQIQLPAPRAALVGRGSELEELRSLLQRDPVRLLTVTGAGGSGKTRLALQAAWDSSAAFDGGAIFVSLAAVDDATGMATVIACALGASQGGGRDLEVAIADHLRREVTQPTLLLLDNCERIASAAPLIGEWLDACPLLKVLATSRAALRIYGEHEYPLAPLPVPCCEPLPPLEELAENPAIALFLQRAAASARNSGLTAENAQAIAELCRRLDGLPLSIELVSAQAGNLTPAAMLARFSGHLDLPAHIARDVPERQRTLRRTMDWSYELLDESERVLFRRLAVFVNGFTAEAVEAVGNTSGDLEADADAALQGLVAKNFIVPLRSEEEPRYTMLESIREYGKERLAASSEEADVRRAHAAYCLVLAEEGNGALSQVERENWLARCDLEHDNFLAALSCLLRRGDTAWALRMGVSLFPYWERREHIVEADRQLRAILDKCGAHADRSLLVKLLNCAGAIASMREQFDECWRLNEDALAISREAGDARGIAASLNSLAVHRQFAGDLVGARSCYEQTLEACRAIGEGKEIAGALSNLAKNDLLLGNHETARIHLQEALELFRAEGDPLLVAWCLNHLGDVAAATDDADEADRFYRESEAMFRSAGDAWGIARNATDRGHLAMARGDLDEAGARFVDALMLFRQLRHRRGIAILLEGCAQLAALRGHDEQALMMVGAARQLRETIAIPGRSLQQARLEEALAPIRRDLDPQVIKAYGLQGASMPLETAIGYALAVVRPGH